MDGKLAFWLGLGLSVPVAIAVNLITPFLQRRLAKINSEYRQRQTQKRNEEASLALYLSLSDRRLMLQLGSMHSFIIRHMVSSLFMAVVGFGALFAFIIYSALPQRNSIVLTSLGGLGLLSFLAAQQLLFVSARERSRLHRITMLVKKIEETEETSS